MRAASELTLAPLTCQCSKGALGVNSCCSLVSAPLRSCQTSSDRFVAQLHGLTGYKHILCPVDPQLHIVFAAIGRFAGDFKCYHFREKSLSAGRLCRSLISPHPFAVGTNACMETLSINRCGAVVVELGPLLLNGSQQNRRHTPVEKTGRPT